MLLQIKQHILIISLCIGCSCMVINSLCLSLCCILIIVINGLIQDKILLAQNSCSLYKQFNSPGWITPLLNKPTSQTVGYPLWVHAFVCYIVGFLWKHNVLFLLSRSFMALPDQQLQG